MKISFIWELGGGLGHLGRQIPIATRFRNLGHDVQFFVPKRYLDHDWLQTFELYETPDPKLDLRGTIRLPNSFQDVLWNLGFRDPAWIESTFATWQAEIVKQDPDLIVLDHSSIALFALKPLAYKLAFVGTGFAIPNSNNATLPRNDYPERIAKTERAVVKNINQALEGFAESPIEHSIDIFKRLDFTGFATYPELDHFGPRPDAEYWGTWSNGEGKQAAWSSDRKIKVFVYLENETGVAHCIEMLMHRDCHVHLYCSTKIRERIKMRINELDAIAKNDFKLEIAEQPLSISGLAQDCDFAITHAGHGATAELLRHGVPMLLVPNMGEQRMVAEKVKQLGAGVICMADDKVAIENGLKSLISQDGFRNSASRFSSLYADWQNENRLDELVDRLVALGKNQDH